jgi:NADH-quinone oxidoreductase subunit G
MVRGEAGLAPTSWATALTAAGQLLNDALAAGGPGGVAVLGGARSTNEGAYAWARLADALGVTQRDAQLGDGLPVEVLGLPRATIAEAASATTIVVVGPDLKEELPVLYLRLRHAAEQRRSRILEISPAATGLTPYAWRTVRAASTSDLAAALAADDVHDQLAAGPVVVVAGRANLAESTAAATATLRTVLDACSDAKILPALRRGNVVGALQLGLAPSDGGPDGAAILAAAAEGRLDCLVLLGADPLADCPDADLARRALAGARRIIAVDTFLTDSSSLADVVLAAAAFGEQDGTTTNLEGRVTTVNRKVTPAGTSRADWMIAAELAMELDRVELADELTSVDAVTAAIAARVPAYAAATPAALAREPDGVLAVAPATPLPAVDAEAGVRISYDYRLVVSRQLYDRAVGTAKSPSLAGLASPSTARVHPLDLGRLGISEGSDVRLAAPKGTLVLPITADASVPRGAVRVPFNAPGAGIADLIDAGATAIDVRIERL